MSLRNQHDRSSNRRMVKLSNRSRRQRVFNHSLGASPTRLVRATDRHRWRDTRNASFKRESGSDRGSAHLRPLGGGVSSARLLATTDYLGHQSLSRAGLAEAGLRIVGRNAGLVADVTRPFRHRPAHGQPISGRHCARRTRHRPRRIRARRASTASPSPERSHRQEGRGLLRSRPRPPQQSRVPRSAANQANAYGKVAECLFVKKLCVIPPTIHPDTGQAYRWIGTPLHEVEFNELPIVEMDDV